MPKLVFSESIRRLGDLLLERKLIKQEQLDEALTKQRQGYGRRVGEILIENGFVSESDVLEVIAEQLHVKYFDLANWHPEGGESQLLKEIDARRNKAIVLKKQDDDKLIVGMADPSDPAAKVRLRRAFGTDFETRLVSATQLQTVLNEHYRRTDEIISLADQLSTEIGEDRNQSVVSALGDLQDSDASVVKLVSSIFTDAVRQEASDIHIQPEKDRLLLRQRIDGVLQEHIIPEQRIASPLVSRLKLLAGLDIAEKRLPQDGRFTIEVDQKAVNCRLSCMPTPFGETLVIRLLNTSTHFIGLDELGFDPELLAEFRRAVTKPSGIILVTGPTGSGKSTTLYAALTELNRTDVKIVTAEDPVEYYLPRAVQVQVNSKIGLTFANVLRSVLRQDPDIVMIGEMRDTETMEIGMRAAMTGHLVMSTLHTRGAIASVNRLIDMGAEPFLIAAVLNAVISQRLARRVCHNCATDSELTEVERMFLEAITPEWDVSQPIKRGTGCGRCKQTGYMGRTGLYEFLFITSELKTHLRNADLEGFTQAAMSQKTYRPILAHGLDAVRNGTTTVSELIRIMGEADAEMAASLKTGA